MSGPSPESRKRTRARSTGVSRSRNRRAAASRSWTPFARTILHAVKKVNVAGSPVTW